MHLDAKGLGSNEAFKQDKSQAMTFLYHHLHEGLKTKYLIIKDPLELWNKNNLLGLIGKKTLSTFHTSNVLLQQQYCERDFKKYFELISCLLVANQNNELLKFVLLALLHF
ncbi:hypothetical protein EPI10_010808 [Gossypium australe]|uniref:Uncharacterized protein n=1 Tax=Gossypium australe TaxID=47621 RepID=A0A5B6W6J4_9ROSI|nr:hypothetical protein EPI10_010808 [Gossypium australe]